MTDQQNNSKPKMVFVFDPVSKKMRMMKTKDKKTKILHVPPSVTKQNKD